MPLPTLTIPLFPDVPNLPGVPPLLRSAFQTASTVVQLSRDLISSLSALPTQKWGIFTSFGLPAIFGDSIKSVEQSQEFRVSDYPQEQGAFQSYNKVQTPFEPRVSITKGGTDNERAQFLSSVVRALASTDLYAVVTPEAIYPSVTLVRYDYQRTSQNGATLLTVNIWLRQVRVTGATAFSATAAPNGASVQNIGAVQPLTLPQTLSGLVSSFLSGGRL